MQKIKVFMSRNLGLKVIAFIITCMIWIFVTNDTDPIGSMTISNVPINIVNEDSIADIGKVVEPQGSGTVTLKVTERRSVRNRLSRTGANFYVEADLENINEFNTVPLTVTCDHSAVSWDEISISPVSLKVKLEDKVEQAFPVNINLSGETKEGTSVGKTEIVEGKNILIAGPESLVEIIGAVNASVSAAGLGEDAELSALLRIYDRNGSEFNESQLSRLELKDSNGNLLPDRSVTVMVTLWETRPQMPISISTYGDPAEGYEVSGIDILPATIPLAATSDTFALIGEQLDIRDRISVFNASSDITREVDIMDTISAYSDLRVMGDADTVVTVTVHIGKADLVHLDLAISDLTIINRPEGMKLVATPADKVTIGLHATDPDVPVPDSSEITAVLDLEPCKNEGNYEIPLEITLPDGFELSDTVTVRVSATKETEG